MNVRYESHNLKYIFLRFKWNSLKQLNSFTSKLLWLKLWRHCKQISCCTLWQNMGRKSFRNFRCFRCTWLCHYKGQSIVFQATNEVYIIHRRIPNPQKNTRYLMNTFITTLICFTRINIKDSCIIDRRVKYGTLKL